MPHNAVTQKIDHSRGRVELLNSYMFYSPNPPKIGDPVLLPEYYDPDRHIFTIRNGKPQIQCRDLLSLHWYTPRTIFLSFLTLKPITAGYPFNRLAHIPAQELTDGKYSLKLKGRESWLKLEQDLLLATATLRDALQLPLFVNQPFAPQAFGFACSAASHRSMKKIAGLSQEWFQVWIAILSYFIAHLGIDNGDSIPLWYTILQSKGFDKALLNGIRSLDVVNFLLDIHRVGTFLKLDDTTAPSPEWFIKFGIPVWYHLDTFMINTARSHPSHPLSHLVPPPELMAAQLKPNLTSSL